jgi:hypothetical protein
MDILENAEVKLSAIRGETDDKDYRKFQAVLKRNPGYSTFMAIRKILDREDTDPSEDISPGKFNLLKFAPVTSCDLESLFLSTKKFCLTGGYPRPLKIMYYCSFITLTVLRL